MKLSARIWNAFMAQKPAEKVDIANRVLEAVIFKPPQLDSVIRDSDLTIREAVELIQEGVKDGTFDIDNEWMIYDYSGYGFFASDDELDEILYAERDDIIDVIKNDYWLLRLIGIDMKREEIERGGENEKPQRFKERQRDDSERIEYRVGRI